MQREQSTEPRGIDLLMTLRNDSDLKKGLQGTMPVFLTIPKYHQKFTLVPTAINQI